MAPNNKRKREDGADDDDIPYGLRQILPVANLPIDFADEPMDGMQYLFTVRRDARNLPGITRAANPYEIPPPRTPTSAFQTPSEPLGDANAPSSLPNEEWRSKFERHFRHFRGNITQPTMQRHTVALSRKSMPDKKSRDAWWAFLQGAPESVWNPPRAAKQSKGRSGQGQEGAQPSPSTSPEDVHTVQPRELSPALLLQLDHRFSLHLIMYFNHWFSLYLESLDSNPESHSSVTYAPTDVHMRWVFSLLTRIDLLCSADEVSCLRSLARACISLITIVRRRHKEVPNASHQGEQAETSTQGGDVATSADGPSRQGKSEPTPLSESSMWVVFCAVTGFWGQRDLWDDAEESLRQRH